MTELLKIIKLSLPSISEKEAVHILNICTASPSESYDIKRERLYNVLKIMSFKSYGDKMDFCSHAVKNIDLNNPRFEESGKCHDWRNHVPAEWKKDWNTFTVREKLIIIVMATMQADKEEWD